MKYLLYILVCMYCFGCVSKPKNTGIIEKNIKPIKKIEIKKVNFYITTIISISCGNFEKNFSDKIETFEITDKVKIKEYEVLINNLVEDTSNYIPNVRAKLLLYYDKRIDTLCMSYHGILLNNIPMLINENLVKKVEELE